MTEVYLITPISNGPLSFSGTYIIYYLNCWAIYLLFGGRYPALLLIGDEEELILRENALLWGAPSPLMAHPAPVGMSRNQNMVSAKKCLSASGSRSLARPRAGAGAARQSLSPGPPPQEAVGCRNKYSYYNQIY